MTLSMFLSHTCRARRARNLTKTVFVCSRLFNKTEISSNEELIINHTVLSREHLTPELQLRLITPECELWHCKSTESKFENDPFWGIYWPGGQALGRYILDNRELFHERNVLDIGSGSGGCAIAAAKCGAKTILANDIDPVSLSAIQINSRLNDVKVFTEEKDLIGKDINALNISISDVILRPKWDIILIGDMFYDTEFSSKLFIWLCQLVKNGKMVLVGDPGRHALKEVSEMTNYGRMVQIAEYRLKNMEHNGFTKASVYKIVLIFYSVSVLGCSSMWEGLDLLSATLMAQSQASYTFNYVRMMRKNYQNY